MRIKLQMPNKIENSTKVATVLKIYRKPGEPVQAGDPLVEMINPDRIFDISSPVRGKVITVNIKEGESVPGGKTLMVIDSFEKEGS